VRYQWGSLPTTYNYTGQRLDGGTGLLYYGARYYDPALMRFVQPDTLVPEPGNPQTLNRYAYTLNNPLKYTDPTGHIVCGFQGRACPAPPTFNPISIQTGVPFIDYHVELAVNLTVCGLLPCKAENGAIRPLSQEEYLRAAALNMVTAVQPMTVVAPGVVEYGGRLFYQEALDKIFQKGKGYVIDAAGYAVERLPGTAKVWDIIRYGAKESLLEGTGFEAHHGVLDAFLRKRNLAGYATRDAPAIVLDAQAHGQANQVFRDWAINRFGSMQNIDWGVVSNDEIVALANAMFNAAGVPPEVQANYWAAFWHYINNLPGG
jgi:RHS repeat-associated protein